MRWSQRRQSRRTRLDARRPGTVDVRRLDAEPLISGFCRVIVD